MFSITLLFKYVYVWLNTSPPKPYGFVTLTMECSSPFHKIYSGKGAIKVDSANIQSTADAALNSKTGSADGPGVGTLKEGLAARSQDLIDSAQARTQGNSCYAHQLQESANE